MEDITKETLKYLGNKHTKVEIKEGFMGNYYSHLLDTIYIAERFEDRDIPKSMKNISPKALQLITVCHECIHSMQSQVLHVINTIFSNLSIILSVTSIVWGIFGARPLWICIIALVATLISIIMRLILEIGAVNGSAKLALELARNSIVPDVLEQDVQEGQKFIHKHRVFAIIQMIMDKIIFIVLTVIIK